MTMTIDNGHLRLTWWDVKRWKLTRPDDIPRTTLRMKIIQDDADDANVDADADDDDDAADDDEDDDDYEEK